MSRLIQGVQYQKHSVLQPDRKISNKITIRKKHIIVIVEMDSNAILVEPLKSQKDPELIRAYRTIILRLKKAGIVPMKHFLSNGVSEAMRDVIRKEYNMEMELVCCDVTEGMQRRWPLETSKPTS